MNNVIKERKANLINIKYIRREIERFKASREYKDMQKGDRYFNGDHDILKRKREAVGEDGELHEVSNLVNNKVIDNQYEKMVIQKTNYLLGQPITIKCEDEHYVNLVTTQLLTKNFQRLMNTVGQDAMNFGKTWLYCYYDEVGEFKLKEFKGYECIPSWLDQEHTELDYLIRTYDVIKVDERDNEKTVTKVDVYTTDGIFHYTTENGTLEADTPFMDSYFKLGKTSYSWQKLPLICFKYNAKEIPLIRRCKSLQDGLNVILSNFQNNMEEDPRNTILILKNYDGENLGEFRKNLNTYGAVKVASYDGSQGGVETLQIQVNADNYKAIVDMFKKAIVENCKGYDAKDERMSGTPNQMNIQSMYSDIDLDANGMETEFQASFEELLYFFNCHLANTGQGNYFNTPVEVIFNRDILINESEAIDNCAKSVGILSNETIVAMHPWTTNIDEELERIKAEREESMNDGLNGMFNQTNDDESMMNNE